MMIWMISWIVLSGTNDKNGSNALLLINITNPEALFLKQQLTRDQSPSFPRQTGKKPS